MFERFTEPARQVVVLAQEESRSLGQPFIAPAHLFLGLIREEGGLAARVLESLGVDYARARSDVVARYGRGDPVTAGQIPFTPEAKQALELALREALAIGHNYIGTEHLLLGLTQVDTQAFTRFALSREQVHEAVLAAFEGGTAASPWEHALDVYEGDEPVADRLESLRRDGWEVVRVTIERRRRRA